TLSHNLAVEQRMIDRRGRKRCKHRQQFEVALLIAVDVISLQVDDTDDPAISANKRSGHFGASLCAHLDVTGVALHVVYNFTGPIADHPTDYAAPSGKETLGDRLRQITTRLELANLAAASIDHVDYRGRIVDEFFD